MTKAECNHLLFSRLGSTPTGLCIIESVFEGEGSATLMSANYPAGFPEDELMTRLIKRGIESGRTDDNEETIKKRLKVYHEQTSPLKEWYKKDGKHCYINGLGDLDRIFADIVAAIDSKK